MKKKINFGMIVCTLVLVLLLPGVSLYQNYLKDKEGPNSTLLVEREYHNRYAKRDAYLKSFGKIMNKNASNPMQMDQILIDSNMPAEELASVLSKGIYGKVDLTTSLASLQNRADLVFFKNILLGNYEEAFRIDPNKLSDSSSVLMAEYANHLYKMKKYDELVNFDNAMLQSTKMYEMLSPDGLSQSSDLTYRDVYLGKICEGAKIIQDRSLFTLVAYNLEKPSYEVLKSDYYGNWNMEVFWEFQKKYANELRIKGSLENDYGIKITEVFIDKESNYSLIKMQYYNEEVHDYVKNSINLQICKFSNDEKAVETPQTILKIIKFFECGAVDYIIEYHTLLKEMDTLNYNEKMKCYGSCGTYSYIDEIKGEKTGMVNIGIYNPDVVREMQRCQNEGIANVIGLSENEILSIEKNLDKKNLTPTQRYLCEQILKNEYNLFEDSYFNEQGEKVKCQFSEFSEAVDAIQNATSGLIIKNIFDPTIK